MIQLLLEPGDAVWIEEPGYPGLRGPLIAAGATPVPVPLDREGLRVDAGRRLAPAARAALVTPTNHYPLGTPPSIARRLALLAWSQSSGAWMMAAVYDDK